MLSKKIGQAITMLIGLWIGSISLVTAQSLEYPSLQTPPPVNDTQLLVWANEATIKLYDFDYAKYREQLQQASRYFLPEAWEVYTEALAESGLLETVKQKKYIVSAVATKPPVITKQTHTQGRHLWEVEMPILVLFQSDKGKQEQHLLIKLTIAATGDTLGTRGLSILSFEAEKVKEF
jgi:intracellular multiplication protein IcmL